MWWVDPSQQLSIHTTRPSRKKPLNIQSILYLYVFLYQQKLTTTFLLKLLYLCAFYREVLNQYLHTSCIAMTLLTPSGVGVSQEYMTEQLPPPP